MDSDTVRGTVRSGAGSVPEGRPLFWMSGTGRSAGVARVVAIQRKKITTHKVNSGARRVDIQRTLM